MVRSYRCILSLSPAARGGFLLFLAKLYEQKENLMGQAASKKPHWQIPETAGRACLLLGQALHQQGYPVEITTCMAPSGCYWRCTLTFNSKDCIYSSANGWALFGGGGWKGWQGYAICYRQFSVGLESSKPKREASGLVLLQISILFA